MPRLAASCLAVFGVAAATAAKCPRTVAQMIAPSDVEVTSAASCREVIENVVARVDGQFDSPPGNGTYAILSRSENELLLTRTSGSTSFDGEEHVDQRLLFTFSGRGGGCSITGCSESQNVSISGLSADYCSMRSLICGERDGCPPLEHASNTKQNARSRRGATADPSACVVATTSHTLVAPAAGPCCKTCEAPLVKFFSTDARHGFCGEACMDPARYALYHLFEANLTEATGAHPCSEQWTPSNTKQYTDYFSTVTHGDPFGILSVTLDLYAPTGMLDHFCCVTPLFSQLHCYGIPGKPTLLTLAGTGPYCCPSGATAAAPCRKGAVTDSMVAPVYEAFVAPAAEPCCKTCKAPLVRFFSTDARHGFCGEACMDPAKYALYHAFEANLTEAAGAHPCSEQWTPSNTKQYTDYFSTVSHGDPSGLLSVTLDLYAPTGMLDHSCCVTPLFSQLHCFGTPGKPTSLTLDGTGPYCCPSGATAAAPCPKGAAAEIMI